MTIKMTGANTLKAGSYLVLEGAACRVISIQISRPGKHGHAKSRIEAVGLIDKKKRITVMPSHDTVEVPMIDKRIAQVLSINGTKANVMDNENYENFELEIPEDLQSTIKEGIELLYWIILNDRIMKQLKGE